jgi:hypothetical protein
MAIIDPNQTFLSRVPTILILQGTNSNTYQGTDLKRGKRNVDLKDPSTFPFADAANRYGAGETLGIQKMPFDSSKAFKAETLPYDPSETFKVENLPYNSLVEPNFKTEDPFIFVPQIESNTVLKNGSLLPGSDSTTESDSSGVDYEEPAVPTGLSKEAEEYLKQQNKYSLTRSLQEAGLGLATAPLYLAMIDEAAARAEKRGRFGQLDYERKSPAKASEAIYRSRAGEGALMSGIAGMTNAAKGFGKPRYAGISGIQIG